MDPEQSEPKVNLKDLKDFCCMRHRSETWQVFRNGFICGGLSFGMIYSVAQDIIGKDAYIKLVEDQWLEGGSFWFWVLAVFVITVIVVRYHRTAMAAKQSCTAFLLEKIEKEKAANKKTTKEEG